MGISRTDFLFSTPSFWEGVGSSVAIAGNYYGFNRSRTPNEADYRAIFSDFAVTGKDIVDAANSVGLDAIENEQKILEKKKARG